MNTSMIKDSYLVTYFCTLIDRKSHERDRWQYLSNFWQDVINSKDTLIAWYQGCYYGNPENRQDENGRDSQHW